MSGEWTKEAVIPVVRTNFPKEPYSTVLIIADGWVLGGGGGLDASTRMAVNLQCELNEALDLLTRTQGGIRNMDEHEEWQRQVQAFFDRNRTK